MTDLVLTNGTIHVGYTEARTGMQWPDDARAAIENDYYPKGHENDFRPVHLLIMYWWKFVRMKSIPPSPLQALEVAQMDGLRDDAMTYADRLINANADTRAEWEYLTAVGNGVALDVSYAGGRTTFTETAVVQPVTASKASPSTSMSSYYQTPVDKTSPSTAQAGWSASGLLSDAEQYAIRQLPEDFPAILYQAKKDYYTLKAGLDSGVVQVTGDVQTAVAWFEQFHRLWEAIRPNYEYDPNKNAGLISAHDTLILSQGDAFVQELGTDPRIIQGLGIAPLIIAGILVAAVAGVAGVIWAIGYVKDQSNISDIVAATVAGKLPADVLRAAYAKADQSGLGPTLANVADIVKWGAVGLALYLFAPIVVNLFSSRKPSRA
jgi:hypothetical protein